MKSAIEVLRDVAVPMRDGVILRADVYLPADRRDPLAALVTRTAYNKAANTDHARLVGLGFAVVVQDKRGRYASEGEYRLLRDDSAGEHQDGYDTVEWVGTQEWCNGAVGAFGTSYLGYTTLGAAISAPRNLRAGVSIQPASDEFTDRTFVDGVLNLANNVSWATSDNNAASLIDRLPPAAQDEARADLEIHRSRGDLRFGQLPLMEWPFLRRFPALWAGPLGHRDDPEYFADNRVGEKEVASIVVPIEHVGGWFDPFARNTVRHYELTSRLSSAGDRQRLVMGPWQHGGCALETSAGVEFLGAAIDSTALVAEWMQHWVKDPSRDDALAGPSAYLYVIGANRWRAEPVWPIPGTVTTALHLAASGSLEFAPPPEGTRTFTYDPHDPYTAPGIADGMSDVSAYASLDNVLAYTTAPLDQELEITGWPRAVLYATTSSTDADWLVEMHVVGADGVARLANEGIARARYREGRERPRPVEPGVVTEYVVALRPISIVLRAGERLRVLVTGGKFPTFERHPNAFVDLNWAAEDDFVAAQNAVRAGGATASRLELPVVPAERRGSWVDNPWPR